MKNWILLGTIAISMSVMAVGTEEFLNRFNTLEKEYGILMKKEDQKFNEERKVAEQAQATLAKQEKMYAELSAKVTKLNGIKDMKFYKAQYEELAKKYTVMLKELETQMLQQKAIIDRFKELEAFKLGNKGTIKK